MHNNKVFKKHTGKIIIGKTIVVKNTHIFTKEKNENNLLPIRLSKYWYIHSTKIILSLKTKTKTWIDLYVLKKENVHDI